MGDVRRAALAYVAGLVLLALGAVGWALSDPPSLSTLAWLSLGYLATQLRRSAIDARSVVFTLSSLIVMAAFPIAGAEAATLLALWGVLALDVRDPVKLSYNGAQDVLCAALGGLAYERMGGPVGHLIAEDFLAVLGPFATAVLVHAATNILLLMVVLRLAQGARLRSLWRSIFARTAPAYVGYGIVGLLLASLWLGGLGPLSLPLLLLPLFIARWVFGQYAAEKESYEATVRTLIQAVETKDHYTRGHSERVSKGSVMIARELRMADDRVESLRYAGLLHDLGKLGVPTRILQKTGRLTADEFAAVQQHPMRGVEIVRDIEFLGEARAGILHHHERVDGLGYPMGLQGEQIPEFARVIGVADAFDAMTTARSYRGARSVEEAVGELQRGRGSQFDPRMVDAFLQALARDGWQTAALPLEIGAEGSPSYDRTTVSGSVRGGDAERSSR